MTAVYYVLVIMVGYFCGCIESGYLVGKLCGMDIRDYGSGNSGTTNVLRVLGKTRALLTFLGDALKSFVPVSYTHLDVYKRQVARLLKNAGIEK